MQQKKFLCDFKILTKTDVLDVHSNILFINGGDVVQKSMENNFIESEKKMISFENFSSETISDYIKFIYLGAENFFKEYISTEMEEESNIFELFDFANQYQVMPLIDCCTNIISLLATKDNADEIQELVTKYNNSHLQELHNVLVPLNDSNS